jgi:hypothetical protein
LDQRRGEKENYKVPEVNENKDTKYQEFTGCSKSLTKRQVHSNKYPIKIAERT